MPFSRPTPDCLSCKGLLFESWGKVDDESDVIRFCNNSAAKPENTATLKETIKRL